MVNSINTNPGILQGLRSLNTTSLSSASTQNKLSSGERVSSARDNAAIFSVAQALRSNLAGQDAVQGSLDRAIVSTDVALSAGATVSNLLIQLKEKAVQARDEGLDDESRRALNDEFVELRDQITSTLESAGFNGTNPLVSGGGDIVAITNETGDGTVTIEEQNLSLGGGNTTLAADQTILSAASAEDAVTAIETSINNVSDVLSTLGSGSQRLEDLKTFTTTLSDTVETGVGNLVDADIGATAASLAADKVKQALGVQSLNIANQTAKNLLTLFQR